MRQNPLIVSVSKFFQFVSSSLLNVDGYRLDFTHFHSFFFVFFLFFFFCLLHVCVIVALMIRFWGTEPSTSGTLMTATQLLRLFFFCVSFLW